MLLNKEFNHFYSNFLITTTTIPADPQFNAVSGGSWQVLTEPRPRRVTTLTITACGEPPTPLPIPQWVIKVPAVLVAHMTPCLTEIVCTNKGRDDSCESNISSFIGAKTTVHIVCRSFISGSSKSPDMVSRICTISYTDPVNVHTIQCQSLVVLESPKSIKRVVLISDDLPTHSGVRDVVGREEHRARAPSTTHCAATQPLGRAHHLQPCRTLGVGLRHVHPGQPAPHPVLAKRGPAVHLTEHLGNGGGLLEPVVSRGSPWPQLGHLLAAGGRIHRDVSEEAQGRGSALHYVPHLSDQSGYGDATGVSAPESLVSGAARLTAVRRERQQVSEVATIVTVCRSELGLYCWPVAGFT